MRTTETITISLPPEMLRQFEAVRKAENRTRSELVREAFRVYLESRFPLLPATRSELAAIRRGRAAFAAGDSRPLDEVLHELEPAAHRTRAKESPKTSGKRSRTR